MKKMIAMFLAFVLLAAVAGLAESAPGMRSDEGISISFEPENDSAVLFVTITDDSAKERDLLAEAGSVSDYFADIVDVYGSRVLPEELLGAKKDQLFVEDFYTLTAEGFDEKCGDLFCTMRLANQLEPGKVVAVLIGQREMKEPGIEWTALMGSVNKDGNIEVTIPGKMILSLQEGDHYLAVVDKMGTTTVSEEIPVPSEFVSSKTVEDLTVITLETACGNASIFAVTTEESEQERKILAGVEGITDYFGTVTDAKGEPVKPEEMLNASKDELSVDEFFGLMATGFDENCGDISCLMRFATPFEEGAKVLVLVGEKNGLQIIWTALEGSVMAESSIRVIIPEEIVLSVQANGGFLGIVSK